MCNLLRLDGNYIVVYSFLQLFIYGGPTQMSRVNGWTNWDTWEAYNIICSSEETYRVVYMAARNPAKTLLDFKEVTAAIVHNFYTKFPYIDREFQAKHIRIAYEEIRNNLARSPG